MGSESIALALAKAQAEFPPIEQNRTVEVKTDRGTFSFTYATLNEIISKTRPALTKYQIAVTQRVTNFDKDQYVETSLLHSSGQSIVTRFPVLTSDSRNPMQALGASVSYARRYGLSAALGLASDEENDLEAAEIAAAMHEQARHTSAMATKKASRAGDDAFWKGPLKKTELKKELQKLVTDIEACEDVASLTALMLTENYVNLTIQCQEDLPSWWSPKKGSDTLGIWQRIDKKTKELEKKEGMQ